MLRSTAAGYPVTPEKAIELVDVFACVRLIAESAAILPLKAYRRTANGRVASDGRLAAVLDRPAPGTTACNLIATTVGSLALRGNAYWGLYRRGGEVEHIGVLSPDRVDVTLVNGEPRYRLTNDRGEQTEHTTADILHFKTLSLDGLTGLSPIAQMRETLGASGALAEFNSSMWANSATPRGVLTVPSGSQKEQIDELRSSFEARHRGSTRAGQIAVLAQEVTFSPISLTPSDAEFIASRKMATQEVARIFKIAPHLIGGEAGTSLHYSTTELDSLSFLKLTLSPYLVCVEQAITASEELCGEREYVEFLTDALLRTDSHTRAQVYALALDPDRGWLTRAEVRQLENRPAEGGTP